MIESIRYYLSFIVVNKVSILPVSMNLVRRLFFIIYKLVLLCFVLCDADSMVMLPCKMHKSSV